mgnify:FL=1
MQYANAEFEKKVLCLSFQGKACQVYSEVSEDLNYSDFILSEDAAKLQGFLSTLYLYYELAKKNNTEEIVKLYSPFDGSRETVAQAIKKNPERYKRFYNVGDIKIKKAYHFNHYYMVGVSWYSKKDGHLADWTELLHCPSSCHMSERLMQSSDDEMTFYLFATAGTPHTGKLQNGLDFIEALYPKNKDSAHTTKIGLALIDYSNMNIKSKNKFETLSKLINTIKANHSEISDVADNIQSWTNIIVQLFKPYWQEFGPNVTYAYANSNYSERRISSIGFESKFTWQNYHTLVGRLAKIDSIKPLALLKGEEVDFLFVSTMHGDEQRLLHFYVSNQNKIISQADLNRTDGNVARLLQHPYVHAELTKFKSKKTKELISQEPKKYKMNLDGYQ